MINQSIVLKKLESKLGFKFMDLELDNEDILNIIKNETIPTFSRYFPYQYRKFIDYKKDLVPGYDNMYYLDSMDENEDFIIINVARAYIVSAYIGFNPSLVLGGNSDTDLISSVYKKNINPTLFQFYPPNKIEIRPAVYSQNFLVLLNVQHPSHLATINPGLEDEFMKLALYDVSESLWKIRNRFSNLQTPFGSIELFLDDLADAPSKKQELLENWRSKFFFQSNRKKIWKY